MSTNPKGYEKRYYWRTTLPFKREDRDAIEKLQKRIKARSIVATVMWAVWKALREEKAA